MRVYLGGKGSPREELALAGLGEATGAPVILLLENGEVFAPADYISLGYTHVEIWCIGASGGSGGGLLSGGQYKFTTERKVMPGSYPHGDLWGAYIASIEAWYARVGRSPSYPVPDGSGGMRSGSIAEYFQYINPTHEFDTRVFSGEIQTTPDLSAIEGAGGGGGLQVVARALADLPEACSVVVGQAGLDAAVGQVLANGGWRPQVENWYWANGWSPYPLGAAMVGGAIPVGSDEYYWANGVSEWMRNYFNPGDSHFPPQPGTDGGVSSFGGDICRASGGKGGRPAKVFSGGAVVVDGDGGDGGAGNRIDAGGGGLGSVDPSVNGKDGIWTPEQVGQGGGGGHGGKYVVTYGWGQAGPGTGAPTTQMTPATSGGKGSFSYADTSVYGPSQQRANLAGFPIKPGGGGGARAPGNRKYGSRALSYNPNGVVLVRLTKIE